MPPRRRLAAVMFTDLVGFTALSQRDEGEALRLLQQHNEIAHPLLTAHHGREVKSTGDGLLAEFGSAKEAVECAVQIQQQVRDRNARLGGTVLSVRIGVHLGDVERRGSDIFGDTVNVGSRVQSAADPGGVCISGAVFEQIRNRLPFQLERLESAVLKGVQVPTDLYRVVLPWLNTPSASTESVVGRLAVLPFANISPDPKDEYFADGLTEELITLLSQLREVQVIARTSVMQFKTRSKGVSQIRNELGVSSILEGSVRKAGDRLRITAQLIDARSEAHLWARTYDRRLDDIFAIQTEIAKEVTSALRIQLRPAASARLETRPTVRPESYVAYLRGRTELYSQPDRDSRPSLEAAKRHFELAISLDPCNAAAHSGLADVTRILGWNFPSGPRAQWDEEGRRLAARAIELDPDLAEAHASLAIILWDDFDYAGAEGELRRATSLNPSYSLAHHWYECILEEEGRVEEALQEISLAEAADPLWPLNLFNHAMLLIWSAREDEALPRIQRLGELEPTHPSYHLALLRYRLARSELQLALEDMRRTLARGIERPWVPSYRALYHALSGEKDRAKSLLLELEAQPDFPPILWINVWAYAELGDTDGCFRWLERAFQSRNVPLKQVRLDPRFETVRRDSRYQELLQRMNLG